MKKQFQILTATFIIVVFISCSKEDIEAPQTPATINEEILTSSSSNRPNNDPLILNLEGRFEFDGNLKEIAARLPNGIPTTRGPVQYTADRKGNEQKALLFDDTYGINLSNIPQQTNTSISVWLYLGLGNLSELMYYDNVVFGIGPTISYRYQPNFPGWGGGLPPFDIDGGVVLSNLQNSKVEYQRTYEGWYHVAVTYDGNTIRHYINGNQVGTKIISGVIKKSRQPYKLGYTSLQNFWAGAMDDLRFYSRTLSAADVQKLFNQ